MIDDLFQAQTDSVGLDLVRRAPPAPKPPEPSTFSGFGIAALSGPTSGFAKGIAFGADILGAFGSVAGAYPEALGGVDLAPEQRKQADAARRKLLESGPDYASPAADPFRQRATDLMPDPLTSGRAAQLVFGLGDFLGQYAAGGLLAGPLAPAVVGGTTGFAEAEKLRGEGVDAATRAKAATVQGVIAGISTVLPVAGKTIAGTVGLVAGAGTAQTGATAATQTILRNAGYEKIGSQYDPFDPWNIALAYAFPGVLGAAHVGAAAVRGAPKLADVVLQNESRGQRYGKDGQLLTSPKGAQGEMQVMPGTSKDPGFGVTPARDSSPDELARVGRDYLAAMEARYPNDPAKALAAYNAGPGALDKAVKAHGDAWLEAMPAETRGYVANGLRQLGDAHTDTRVAAVVEQHPELVDAARTHQVAEAVDSGRLTDGSIPSLIAHDEASGRAFDQIGRGEPVDIAASLATHPIDPERIAAMAERVRQIPVDEAPAASPQSAEPVIAPADMAARPASASKPAAAPETPAAEPSAAGAAPAPEAAGAARQGAIDRLDPALVMHADEAGTRQSAHEYVASVTRQAGEDAKEAGLLQAAVDCLLGHAP